jgi:hypothetical protein
MLNFLKRFELPHITVYKRRGVRRVMIILTLPQEVARAIFGTFYAAKCWWNWDGVLPPGAPQS